MRKELIKEIIKEVYGPRKGAVEGMSDNPIDEYLTGVLIPQEFKLSTDEGINEPDSEMTKDGGDLNPEDNSTDDEIDVNVPSELDPRMRTKSFGISFVIKAQEPSFKICITWGRYFKIKDEEEKENLWRRKSYYDIHEISLDNSPEEFMPIELDNKEKDGKIILYVKKTRLDDDDKFHITANIVNNLDIIEEKEFKPTSACIFQPSMRINLMDEKQLPNFDQIREEDELDFVYRNRPFKAHGHMCSALWHDMDYLDEFETSFLWPDGLFHSNNDAEVKKFIKPHLRTEFVPLYPMPLSSFKLDDDETLPELSAEVLSEIWSDEDFDKFLSPLVEKYEIWITGNTAEKRSLPDKYKKTADKLINNQNMALERIKLGLNILKSNDDAKLAFCFANKAIYLQYEWSGKNEPFVWRSFQLAFFLMNIESIYNEDSDDRNILDLLWISTGGGKTEAYLAIMAFTMALRRIKALDSSNGMTGGGTSIISRYTLRLLTVQQFRRTLKLITAAELLRISPNKDGKIGWRPRSCEIENHWIYGSTRFSVGMWVGGAVSPLHLRKKEWGAIALLRKSDEDGEENSSYGEPAQIIKCPACGAWLTIPQTGLPKDDNKVHFVVELLEKEIDISSIITDLKDSLTFIENIDFTDKNHLKGNLTLSFTFANQKIDKKNIDDLWNQIKDKFVPASLNLQRPGYFGSRRDLAQNKERDEYSDFEIWCPDPDCDLNNASWKEGVPYKDDKNNPYEFPDGSYERIIVSPFKKGSRIPIPAYTVDEQVYARCPTVIISTADKIARLAFEPRAAAIFGNVDCYNQFYGYHRKNLFPDNSPIGSRVHDMPVEPFNAPDLIIQDELHLIDGPLGSLFGLYEAIADGIIKKKGGNAKYIASTATIMNATEQVNLLFSKNLFQFPPYGLSIDDSFFVKEKIPESAWDEEKEGRIYMGLYAPGRGPMTPQVNLWARILKTSYDHQEEKNILYYWTLVGYYNAIRELGGGGALYREDIVERLKTISDGKDCRTLDHDHTVELSSRMNSTVIPLKLGEIERDGKRSENESPFYDAIFTTSMFGTGVDISHLSMMIVNGQPKTTGSYIQATGRIGRSHGGLIVTFYKAGRPRDLSHYETFPSYHHRIHVGIEPVSVSPFSKGALWKAIGATTVSFLRNANDMGLNWHDEDGRIICDPNAMDDIEYLCKHLESRLNDIYGRESKSTLSTLKFLKTQIQRWKKIADNVDELKFYEYSNKWHEPKSNVILGDPAHEHAKDLETVYKNVPQSLREIEETTGFWV